MFLCPTKGDDCVVQHSHQKRNCSWPASQLPPRDHTERPLRLHLLSTLGIAAARTKISTAESEDRRGDRQNQHHSLHYITDSCTDGTRASGSGLRDSTAASLLGWSGSAASSLTPVLTRPHTQPQDGPQTFQSVTIIPKTQPKNSNSLYSLTLRHS